MRLLCIGNSLESAVMRRDIGMSQISVNDSMSQISVNDLTFYYDGSYDSIFEKVSFQIDQKTMGKEEGKNKMSDREKFEGFKKELVEKNEQKYGKEVREKYGDEVVDQSNAKMMGLTEEQYTHMQELGEKINLLLEEAVKNHEYVEDEIGEQVALLHKEWLSYTWPTYSTQAHRGLVQMYVLDERFKAYYDKNVEGCAEFLKQAVEYHIV